jgi:hypothetical protein
LALGSYSLLLGLLLALVFLFPEARQTEFPYSDYYANNWLAVSIYSILLGLLVALIVPWKWPVISLSLEALDVAALMLVGIILTKHLHQALIEERDAGVLLLPWCWRSLLSTGVNRLCRSFHLPGKIEKALRDEFESPWLATATP